MRGPSSRVERRLHAAWDSRPITSQQSLSERGPPWEGIGAAPVPETHRLKTKICLVGDHAVGKTSLIRRFVLDTFDDRYLMTLGTKVTKKEVDISFPDRGLVLKVDMAIWDIMGQHGFLDLLHDAYFTGANGILAVLDPTRRTTLDTLGVWIRSVERVAGRVPTLIAMNKCDIEGQHEYGVKDVERIARGLNCGFLTTSAKTGDNVETIFQRLGSAVGQHQMRLS